MLRRAYLADPDSLIVLALAKLSCLALSARSADREERRMLTAYGAPQWRGERNAALRRAKQRLARATIEGVVWYWPASDRLRRREPDDTVRLLAPFDPVVWDRRRFELFWNWAYRFEAYTPASKRKLGYYAMPLMWRDSVIGWANVAAKQGKLDARLGYVSGRAPDDAAFKRELDAEFERLEAFLRPRNA